MKYGKAHPEAGHGAKHEKAEGASMERMEDATGMDPASTDKKALMKKFADRRKAKVAPKKKKGKKKTVKRRSAKKAVKKGRTTKTAARGGVGDKLNSMLGIGPFPPNG